MPQENHGMVAKLWNWMNEGVISQDTLLRAATGMTKEQFDYATGSYESETPVHAAARQMFSGSLSDTAQLGSDFSSPMSLAMMALGPLAKSFAVAEKALPVTSKLASALKGAKSVAEITSLAASMGFGVNGAKNVVANLSDAIKQNPDAVRDVFHRIVDDGLRRTPRRRDHKGEAGSPGGKGPHRSGQESAHDYAEDCGSRYSGPYHEART
jgi:hypothetical protein